MIFELREWTSSKQVVLVGNIMSLKVAWLLKDKLRNKYPRKIITIFCRGGKWNEAAAN